MKQKLFPVKLRRDELERSLGGGIPTSSLMLLEGPDGAGKSLISQRFCYGLLRGEKTVTYISSELNTQGFIEQMASLDYDIKYDMLDDKLLFIPMFPYYGQSRLNSDMLSKLIRCKRIFDSDVVIFDTLSFLLIQDNISQEESLQFISFLKQLTSLEKTVIVCVDPDHLNAKFLTLLKSVCDVILDLELRTFAGALVRLINVKRFKRSGSDVLNQIPFRVEPGKGLVIEIASFS
jgi:archaeal flagellar protein FlaH